MDEPIQLSRWRQINATPLRDLLRGRVSGRLDWRSRVDNSALPVEARDLIQRVVQRTRLWRLEKPAVADELIAHFADGVAAGTSASQLIAGFGNERVAAKLMRRAKRRGRPLAWRAFAVSFRVLLVFLAAYAVLLIRFCAGRPQISVDYVAQVNQPVLDTPADTRAWPLWRAAIIASASGFKDGSLVFANAINPSEERSAWIDTVAWLRSHGSAIDAAREAGQKQIFGFVLGPSGPIHDPALHFNFYSNGQDDSLGHVVLPYLNYTPVVVNLLSFDARNAAESGDGNRAEADLMSLLGLSRQLREADGFYVTQKVGLEIAERAVKRLQFILWTNPAALSGPALIRLSRAFAKPQVAADLISVNCVKAMFADMAQRTYSDDGRGDGHLTLRGWRLIPALTYENADGPHSNWASFIASTVPEIALSRAQIMAQCKKWIDDQEAQLHLPLRQVPADNTDAKIARMRKSPIDSVRYGLLLQMMPGCTDMQASCETYLGERDGTLVAIALELYRRDRGRYPASLEALVPDLLPCIPADRITGDPVRYRLRDGRPIIYSVGADGMDDGGVPADTMGGTPDDRYSVQWLAHRTGPIHKGDWILYGGDVEQ